MDIKEESQLKDSVEKALNKIRPMLQAEGGDVELVSVREGSVNVRLKGACGGCPMAMMTLKNGIERLLKKELDWVKEVRSV